MLATLEPLILVVHLLLCVFLIVVILLQAGKGADMGATFGAGGSQSLFGARGAATMLSKVTAVCAIMFLVTSLTLAGIHKNKIGASEGKSVLEKTAPLPAPAAPAPVAPAVPAP